MMVVDASAAPEALLRQAGMKATVPRLRVLGILRASEHAQDVQEIYLQLLQTDRSTNLSTVYAVLKQLADVGLVVLQPGPGRKSAYALNTGRSVALARCLRCGKVVDLPSQALEPVLAQLVAEHGGTLASFTLEVAMVCEDCQGK